MEKKFSILGEEIIITPKMESMLRMQMGYRIMAQQYTQAIDKDYSSFFKKFEDFLEEHGLEEMAFTLIGHIMEFTQDGLKQFNIELNSSYSKQVLRQMEKCNIFNVIDEFKNVYNTLLNIKEQSREIRELRKESAPRFEGFGFGISGAIKGAVKAELANAGVDALHSLFNSVGNARTEYQVKNTMDKIYNDPNTRKSIMEIMCNDLTSFYFLARDIINDSLPYSEKYYSYSKSDSDSAEDLYLKITDVDKYIENYKAHINFMIQAYSSSGQYNKQMAKQDLEEFYEELNQSNKEHDIKEILKKFPFKYKYYELYFDNVDQVDKDIEQYARLCGFDITDLIKKRYETKIKKEQIRTEFAKAGSKLYEKMMNNKFYTLGNKVNNKFELIRLAVNNVSSSSIRNNVFTLIDGVNYKNRLNSIVNSYAKLDGTENVLVIFDNTVFRSAKDGFIITNKNIYAHNMLEEPMKIPLNQIDEIIIEGSDLVFNYKHRIGINLIDKDGRQEFVEFIMYLVLELVK